MGNSDIPRRICIDKFIPAERAIYDAVQAVEAVGADPRLTDAVILLGKARDKVADYVDGVGRGDETAPRDMLPAYRLRPALTPIQAQWMLMRAVCGKGVVSDRAMAEWNGEVAPNPKELNPPMPISDRVDYR